MKACLLKSVVIVYLALLVLAVATSASVYADEKIYKGSLKRLFTTPAERKRLNLARKRFLRGVDVPQPEQEDDTSAYLREIKYDGVVMREDGKHKIWINGVDVSAYPDARFQSEVLADRSVRLTISDGQEIRLYPGQVYRFEDGLIQEAYQLAQLYDDDILDEELEEDETDGDDEEADQDGEESKPIEFKEEELAEQISRIRLLEDRIMELEKRQTAQE